MSLTQIRSTTNGNRKTATATATTNAEAADASGAEHAEGALGEKQTASNLNWSCDRADAPVEWLAPENDSAATAFDRSDSSAFVVAVQQLPFSSCRSAVAVQQLPFSSCRLAVAV
jgi:hypothetical protein